jgi:hypothetical protein
MGKIAMAKSIALSKLVHLFMVLPNPTNDFFKRLDTMIYQFIWGGGNDKIKRSVIIGKINQGGLNMTHLQSFCYSLKMIWIKELLNPTYISS